MNPHLTWRTSSFCGNNTCVEVAAGEGGIWHMRDNKLTDSPVLTFSADGWREFLNGIRSGDFDLR